MPYIKAKMHQIRFQPAGGDYSAPPDPLAGFEGPTSKGREEKKDGREGQGRGRREGRGPTFKARGKGGGGKGRGELASKPKNQTSPLQM